MTHLRGVFVAGVLAFTLIASVAPAPNAAAAHQADRTISACVTHAWTADYCLDDEPLGLRWGKPFRFRGLATGAHGAGVTVWRQRPNGRHWVLVGSAPINARHRFNWEWRTHARTWPTATTGSSSAPGTDTATRSVSE